MPTAQLGPYKTCNSQDSDWSNASVPEYDLFSHAPSNINIKSDELPNNNQQLNGKECYNNKNNKTKGFKIAHLNIRSLIKNIDQLRIYIFIPSNSIL